MPTDGAEDYIITRTIADAHGRRGGLYHHTDNRGCPRTARRIISSHGQSRMPTDDTEDHIIIQFSHAHMGFSRTPQRGMRSLAQGKRSRRRSGTLGKKPHGPRPTGARGNISKRNFQSSLLPRCLSLRPATCCPVAFPFGRRRAAPLPFPSAGDLRFGAFPSSVDIRDCPCENMMHYF